MSSDTSTNKAPTSSNPWDMTVGPGGNGGEYALCPAGTSTGILVGLFDVGHHQATNKQGESYDRRELVVVYELIRKRPDGKPFVLAERYTWSMKDNSNFYALACNLTGVKYKDGERFDPRTLLGLPCSISITHSSGKRNPEKTYHNIGGVQQWASEDDEGNPKPRPKPTRELIAWSILGGQPLPDVSWVPRIFGETIAAMVESSSEWRLGEVPCTILPRENQPSSEPADQDDDIPF